MKCFGFVSGWGNIYIVGCNWLGGSLFRWGYEFNELEGCSFFFSWGIFEDVEIIVICWRVFMDVCGKFGYIEIEICVVFDSC